MFNYPDGMTGREFDTCEIECVCPDCGAEWWEEVNSGWGEPSEIDVECGECGKAFTAYNE